MTSGGTGYRCLAVETICSISHRRAAGHLVLDFVVDLELAGWYGHEFDVRGGYQRVRPVEPEAVCAVVGAAELGEIGATLELAVGGLLDAAERAALAGDIEIADALSARAGAVERERLRLLDAQLSQPSRSQQ